MLELILLMGFAMTIVSTVYVFVNASSNGKNPAWALLTLLTGGLGAALYAASLAADVKRSID